MRVIAVVGPTASGKTALGVSLARALNGEVISADSRQVYRGLTLGTGKVTAEEMQGVPHHLLDVIDPSERFTVHDFVRLGRVAVQEIAARGRVPIVVGGTGMYVDALLGRLTLDAPPGDEQIRSELGVQSLEALHHRLKNLDPNAYARVDLKNRRRVERALEIALSEVRPHSESVPKYEVTWVGLTLAREELKERIKTRLASRLAAGMLDEAHTLHEGGLSYERMEDLGLEYRYMARHLQGLISHDDMVKKLESEIYKYAKRQITRFKRNEDIRWFDARQLPSIDNLVHL